jgi:hypothetical protein
MYTGKSVCSIVCIHFICIGSASNLHHRRPTWQGHPALVCDTVHKHPTAASNITVFKLNYASFQTAQNTPSHSKKKITTCMYNQQGQGKPSRYSNSLQAGRSRDQIMVEASLSTLIQTGAGAHPASYTMGTGSFLGVKRPRHGVNHLPPSSTKVKERVELYLYSPSVPSWQAVGWIFMYI